jgi:hypothetical protein
MLHFAKFLDIIPGEVSNSPSEFSGGTVMYCGMRPLLVAGCICLAQPAPGGNGDERILFHTNITDGDLDSLQSMKSLEYLSLYHTKITDAGMKKLVGLPKLHSLNLGWTSISKVTRKGVEALEAALPDLLVLDF